MGNEGILLVMNWYVRVLSQVPERLKLGKLGNIRKIQKIHRIIASCLVLLPKGLAKIF